jgi:Ankyrin repeats (3 copies)/Ankyrin repeat
MREDKMKTNYERIDDDATIQSSQDFKANQRRPQFRIYFFWSFCWNSIKFRHQHQIFPTISVPKTCIDLPLACRLGECDTVEELLKHEDINSNDGMEHHGVTPLHIAIIHEKYDLAMSLLRKGAFIGTVANNGWTPLHVASSMGCAYIVHLLLEEYKADHQVRDSRGWTPLFVAIFRGHVAVISILLDKEVCIQDLKKDKDYFGQTLLMTACQGGNEDVLEMLLTFGIDNINDIDQDGWTAFTFTKRRKNCKNLLKILHTHFSIEEIAYNIRFNSLKTKELQRKTEAQKVPSCLNLEVKVDKDVEIN